MVTLKLKPFFAAFALALALPVFAQEATPPLPTRAEAFERSLETAKKEVQKTMSFNELWVSGGILMWFLAAASVFGLSVVFYLLWILRDRQVAPPELTASLLAAVQNGDLGEARSQCADRPCQLSAVMLAAFDHLQHSSKVETGALREAVEAEGTRQAQSLQGQAQLLLDIGVIAPMLGLLGTVLGMLQAFGAISTDIASAKPVVLAAGVSKAIITTVFGLFVAIPAMVFYAYLRRRAAAKIAVLEACAARIVTVLSGRFHA